VLGSLLVSTGCLLAHAVVARHAAKSMSMELEAESEVPASENDYGASQTRSGV
jgi:hypothetical protein